MTYLYEGKDDCTYYFEWYTSAACPITVLEGSDCKIEDTRAGVSLDPWLARSGVCPVFASQAAFVLLAPGF